MTTEKATNPNTGVWLCSGCLDLVSYGGYDVQKLSPAPCWGTMFRCEMCRPKRKAYRAVGCYRVTSKRRRSAQISV